MPLPPSTAADVLALLTAEAPEPELHAALDQLAARCTTEAERGDIARLAQHARSLHRSRQDDRRRAVGLAALSDTAADLATHRDLNELLRAICSRARALLGTDVAYVTLVDEGVGDTYVRATDGIVSESFQTMRLPVGVGIGGLAAATNRPQATADYGSDDRLSHVHDVDRRVQTEGLRAIAAVPLQSAGVSFGVLLSASRVVRHFAPEELALFQSLGTHAAIAIENARLLEGSRQALADLARAHELAQAHAARVELVAAAKDRLTSVALDGGGLQELVAEAVTFVTGRLEVVDAHGTVLASAGDEAGEQVLEARIPGNPDDLGRARLHTEARGSMEQEIVDRVSGLAAGVLLQQRVQSETDYRYRSRLLEQLLDGQWLDEEEPRRWLARAGIGDRDDHVVLVIAPPPSTARWAWLTAVRAAVTEQGVVGTVAGRVVAILPGSDTEQVAARWSALVREAGAPGPTIGTAQNTAGLRGLPSAYRDAVSALSILTAMGHAGASATVSQLGIFGHMLSEPGRGDLRSFLDRTLGVLSAHDDGNRSPLLPVLEAFFAEAGHLARTARRLNVHINTLYQRLERLDHLLGPAWRGPDQRLELHLALRLRALDRDLRERGPGAGGPTATRHG